MAGIHRKITDEARPIPGLPAGVNVAEAIILLIKAGNTQRDAAGAVGIWPETLSRWLTRGANELTRMATEGHEEPEETEADYVNLTLELMYAQAESKIRMTAAWQGHFGKDYKAVRDFMAQRWPDEWGSKPSRVELSGPGGGPVPVAAAVMSLDEAEEMLARVEARAAQETASELIEGTG